MSLFMDGSEGGVSEVFLMVSDSIPQDDSRNQGQLFEDEVPVSDRGSKLGGSRKPQSSVTDICSETHQNEREPRVSFSQAVVVGVGQHKFMNTWL